MATFMTLMDKLVCEFTRGTTDGLIYSMVPKIEKPAQNFIWKLSDHSHLIDHFGEWVCLATRYSAKLAIEASLKA